MAYLVDSDWTIDNLAEVPEAQRLFDSLLPEGAYISIVTYMEVFQGSLRRDDPAEGARLLRAFVVNVPVIPVTIAVAERCARLRQHFLDQGQRPTRRGFDLLIAATAIEHDLTLVTRNVRDYADIPGLTLYQQA